MSRRTAAQRAALRAAFGSSDSEAASGDDEAGAACAQDGAAAPSCTELQPERHAVVAGLSLLRGFLSEAAQAALLAAVCAQGWAPPGARNQAMHFGYATMPPFMRRLADEVAAAAATHALLPPELLRRSPPAFNQLICNGYAPGANVSAWLQRGDAC
jgi:hypothetical protein